MGSTREAMVVLVACTPWVGLSSWWALPVFPVDQAFFPNVALRLPLAGVVTLCFGMSDSLRLWWDGLCERCPDKVGDSQEDSPRC